MDNESPYFEDLDDYVAGYTVGFFVTLVAAAPFLFVIVIQEVINKFKN